MLLWNFSFFINYWFIDIYTIPLEKVCEKERIAWFERISDFHKMFHIDKVSYFYDSI